MDDKKPCFVAYMRVSTHAQGQSGLGLSAQESAVREHVARTGGVLVGEFIETESGKGADALARRPQLAAALALARAKGAVLLIAKLDRLARNVHFVSGLLESRVEFCACDMPTANKLTLHVMAAFAEHEREMISMRTKAALKAARERGVELGAQGRRNAVRFRAEAADRLRPLAPRLRALQAEGLSVRAIAERLNSEGVPSPGGAGRWRAKNTHLALKRLPELEV